MISNQQGFLLGAWAFSFLSGFMLSYAEVKSYNFIRFLGIMIGLASLVFLAAGMP